MSSRLIIECGSSKSDWIYISDHQLQNRVRLDGYNPYLNPSTTLQSLIDRFKSNQEPIKPDLIKIFGAGINQVNSIQICDSFLNNYPNAKVDAYSDIYGSAHATVDQNSGWVGILGTGSNLAYFKDGHLVYLFSGLGWLLGDEGGGRSITRGILRQYCRHEYSEELMKSIEMTIGYSSHEVIKRIYSTQDALGFVDDVMLDLSSLLNDPQIVQTSVDEISRFLDNIVHLQNKHKATVHLTGSVAYSHMAFIREYLENRNVTCGEIVRYPIEQLIKRYVREDQ
jgi:N-acetylglucosamine kinase-like BadF-type ATPase